MSHDAHGRPASASSSAGAAILDGVDLDVAPGELRRPRRPQRRRQVDAARGARRRPDADAGSVRARRRRRLAAAAAELGRRRGVLLQKQTLAFGFRAVAVVEMGRSPWHRTPRAADDDDRRGRQSMERADVVAPRRPRLPDALRRRAGARRVRPRAGPGGAGAAARRAHRGPRHPSPGERCSRSRGRAPGRGRRGRRAARPLPRRGLRRPGLPARRAAGCAPTVHRATCSIGELLTEVYDHPIEVVEHARSARGAAESAAAASGGRPHDHGPVRLARLRLVLAASWPGRHEHAAHAAAAASTSTNDQGAAVIDPTYATSLTVRGSGFQSVQNGHGGVYVFFGTVSGGWRPSAGRPDRPRLPLRPRHRGQEQRRLPALRRVPRLGHRGLGQRRQHDRVRLLQHHHHRARRRLPARSIATTTSAPSTAARSPAA